MTPKEQARIIAESYITEGPQIDLLTADILAFAREQIVKGKFRLDKRFPTTAEKIAQKASNKQIDEVLNTLE